MRASGRTGKACKLLAPCNTTIAHLASCMAENGLTEPVSGVTFDWHQATAPMERSGAASFVVGDYCTTFGCASAISRYVGMPVGRP